MKVSASDNPSQQPSKYQRLESIVVAAIVFSILIVGAAYSISIYKRLLVHSIESKVLRNLYEMHAGQKEFRSINGRYGTLKELAEANLIDPNFAGDQKEFRYKYWLSDLSSSTFCFHADRKAILPSNKDFNISEDGAIHFIRSDNLSSVQRGQGEKADF